MNTTHNVIAAALFGVALAAGCASHEYETEHEHDSWARDAEITTKVKAKFLADSTVSAADIRVDTIRGTVQLSGFARNIDEITRASDIAWHTEGVRYVQNDVHLRY